MKVALVPIELVIKAEPDHVHGHLVCRDIHARAPNLRRGVVKAPAFERPLRLV